MPRETEFALMPAIIRLEQRDAWMTCIDLRGKGKSVRRQHQCDDAMVEHLPVPPNPLIEKFSLALKYYNRPQLKSLALHNHFLDPSELPLLFDALPVIPSLDSLVLFHHDLCDDGVELLMQTLLGRKNTGSTTATTALKELYISHCNVSTISHNH